MNRFTGKTAIITGASSGIGACTAKTLAADGANLVLAARHPEKLQATAQECAKLGAQVLTVCADVSREPDCAALAEAAMARFGAIDILVNNAGALKPKKIEDMWTGTVTCWRSIRIPSFI